MPEPVLFGFPITLLFLYFIAYSFLGWVMETTYCSVLERRFVARGFLYGPICPIYGVGVLMMICWFAPFVGNPVVFYLVATVCMSAWEYLVGWFLETTTHIKYWDYSMYKFNLHGRICLWVCLMWGVLAYAVIFWVHPLVAGLLAVVPTVALHAAALVLLVLLVGDTAATIHELTLLTRMLNRLTQMGEELQLQLALGKAELTERLGEAKENLSGRLDEAKATLVSSAKAALDTGKEHASAEGAETAGLRERYEELLKSAERQTRHLRNVYRDMSSQSLSVALSRLTEAGRRNREEKEAQKALRRAARYGHKK